MAAVAYDLPQMDDCEGLVEILTQSKQNIDAKDIPEEIWSLIFSNLLIVDLKCITLVCKRFNLIVTTSLDFLKRTCIKLTNEIDLVDFQQSMAASSRRYQNVEFNQIVFDSATEELLSDAWYVDLLQKFPIVELRIVNCRLSERRFAAISQVVQQSLRFYSIDRSTIYYRHVGSINDIDSVALNMNWENTLSVHLSELNVNYNRLLKLLPRNAVFLNIFAHVEEMDDLLHYINQQHRLKALSFGCSGSEFNCDLDIVVPLEKFHCQYMGMDDIGSLILNQFETVTEMFLEHDELSDFDQLRLVK